MELLSEREKSSGPTRNGMFGGFAGAGKDDDEGGGGPLEPATEGTPLLRQPQDCAGASGRRRGFSSSAGPFSAKARRLILFCAASIAVALAIAAAFLAAGGGASTAYKGDGLDTSAMGAGWLWGSSSSSSPWRKRGGTSRHHGSRGDAYSVCEHVRRALLELGHERDRDSRRSEHGHDKKNKDDSKNPAFRGQILFPDRRSDAREFDASVKVWNERYNSRRGQRLSPPCASVIPSSEEDVATIVPLLVQHGAAIVIKSGGHCYADYSSASGGEPSESSTETETETPPKVLLDLAHLNDLRFDYDDDKEGGGSNHNHRDTVLAIMGPGTTMGQILRQKGLHDDLSPRHGGHATHHHDEHHHHDNNDENDYYYAGVLGSSSTVAAGGYILGGGYGYWSRKHGLAIDNLVEARVVLANGTVVAADSNRHSDLFWALRGAGQATLGVVTQYTYRLHRAHRNVLVATAFELPPHDLIPLLVAAGQGTASSPSSSYPWDCHMEVMSNTKGAELDVACPGATERDVDTLQHKVKEYLRSAAPRRVADRLVYNRTSWIAMAQEETDSFQGIMVQYWNGMLMPSNNNADTWHLLMDALFGLSRNNPHVLVDIELRGGAIAQVDSHATAFPWRTAAYVVGVGVMVSPKERRADAIFREQVDRANKVWEMDVAPLLQGMFPNYAMASLRAAPSAAAADLAWGDNAARLERIKALYDPTNAFRGALPIVPAPVSASEETTTTSSPSAARPSPVVSLPPTAQPTTSEAAPTDAPSPGPSPSPTPLPVDAPETSFPTLAAVDVGGGGDRGGDNSNNVDGADATSPPTPTAAPSPPAVLPPGDASPPPPSAAAPAASPDSSSSTAPSFAAAAQTKETSPPPTTSMVGTAAPSSSPGGQSET